MTVEIISTANRPDLAELTARWRWEAFCPDHVPFSEVLAYALEMAVAEAPTFHTLVLLEDGEPVGTASLSDHDLEERPDLTPWLAGVFVAPHARHRGYATKLVRAVEQLARDAGVGTFWLYTHDAERLYAGLGWRTVETIEHDGKPAVLMRRDLVP